MLGGLGCLCISLLSFFVVFTEHRVKAGKTQLELVAEQYPAGSEEQRMALLAEMQRERHPSWKDLSLPEATARAVVFARSVLLQPRASGTTVQTAANFAGNLTTLTGSPQTVFSLVRQANCSITKLDGTYVFSATNPNFTIVTTTPNYERILHTAAGLTTTAGTYSSGCASSSIGISSRRGVYTGRTSQNLSVFAATGYNYSSGGNAIYSGTVNSNNQYNSYNIDTSNPNVNSVATGDFNGDGIGDLVEVNQLVTTGSITLLMGQANGTFTSAVTYVVPLDKAVAAVVEDFNGDGKLDVAVASVNQSAPYTQDISILTGKGDGTLNAAQTFSVPNAPTASGGLIQISNLIAVDLGGNGHKDIVTSNGLALLNNGNGTFTTITNAFPARTASSNFGPNLAAGDLNRDGRADVAVDDGQKISIYLGKGDGTFAAAGGYATIDNVGYITIADLDGDGNADIFTGLGNGLYFGGDQFGVNTAYALMGNGDGTFQGAPALPASYLTTNLGDVTGDKRPDLVGLNGATFTTYIGKSDGSFSIGPSLSTNSFSYGGRSYTYTSVASFAVGDMNGDGRADLILTPSGIASYDGWPFLLVALGQSDGTFATPTIGVFPGLAAAGDFDQNMAVGDLHIADINKDGFADVLYVVSDVKYKISPSTQTYVQGIAVLPGNGDGTFKTGTTSLTYSSATTQNTILGVPVVDAIADVNRDGKPDLIAISRIGSAATGFGSEARLYLGAGDGTFGTYTVVPTAPNPRGNTISIAGPGVVLADMNNDGNQDLVSVGQDSSRDAYMGIALGNGDGTFRAVQIQPMPGGDIIVTAGLAAADIDGDGKTDVVVTSFSSSISGIYPGNGDGTVQTAGTGSITPPQNFNLEVYGATTVADFNGDGKMDVLAGNSILLNLAGRVTTPTLAASTTALAAAPTSLTVGQNVTLTATVTGTAGVAAGTVTFTDSAAGGAATTLGTGTLDGNGVATFSTTGLSAGSHSISASYSGSAGYLTSVSTAVTVVVAAAPISDFTLALSPMSGSVNSGSTTTTAVSVTPVNGFNQLVSFTCSGLPTGVTCGFSPATVIPAGATATTTLTFTRSASATLLRRNSRKDGIVLGVLLFGCLLVRRKRRVVSLLSCFVVLIGLAGCGKKASTPASVTSTVTVTATAGTMTRTANFTLTSQ
jgi:hypothetical protein